MSDPPRLSATEPGGLTAAMLDSARDDEPPASARQRALVALGAGAGAMLTAGMAEGGAVFSAGAAGTAASGASVAAATKVAAWVAIAKWAGGGAVVAVCTAAAVASVAPRPSTVRIDPPAVVSPAQVPVVSPAQGSSPAPGSIEPAVAVAPVSPAAEIAPPEAPSEVAVSGTPSRGQVPAPSRAARSTSPSAVPDTTIEPVVRAPDENLAGEVGSLDRASATIRSGDVEQGLQMLDEYRGRFPGGVLTPESQVLRIEALVRKGDRVSATRLGEAFLGRTPQSALAARVRSLLLSIQKEPTP